MKIRLLFVPLLLALVASLAACGGGGSKAVPATDVAVVDGTPITTATFNTWFTAALALTKAQTGAAPKPGTPEYKAKRDGTIAYLVQFEELKQQAQKEHVSVTPTEVHKFLVDLAKSQYHGSQSKLAAYYKGQGMSMQLVEQLVYINQLSGKIRTKVTASAKVTEAQEKAYYNSNIAQYNTPAQKTRSVEHILVKQKSLADTIEQKLKHGASFASLAKQYSKDPGSAAQGGKFTATQGKEVPAYDQVAFSLKTGELSAPVDATSAANGSYGWFIIKALGPVQQTKAHTTSFEAAKSQIQQTLISQQQETLWQQWVSDLTKTYQGKISYQAGYAPPTTTALSQTAVTTG